MERTVYLFWGRSEAGRKLRTVWGENSGLFGLVVHPELTAHGELNSWALVGHFKK